jgi:hypothetical protein
MTRRSIRAFALPSLLAACLLAASPADATVEPASALAQRQRLVFVAVPLDGNCGCSPYDLGEFDLFDRAAQPRGVLNVFGIPTSPPDVPDEDASGIVTMVVTLDDGTIVAQGQFPLDDGAAIVAIVGGTGRYRRARGYARFAPRPQGQARVVLHLLP